MDWFAVSSIGTYPTPGVTSTQRAAYASSYGLLGLLPAGSGLPATTASTVFILTYNQMAMTLMM